MITGRPARRTDAERFDPALRRVEWRTRAPLSFDALVEELRSRLGPSCTERVLRHGGLQLDGRPVGGDLASVPIPSGTRVRAWALLEEPEAIPVGPERVLFDDEGVVAVDKPAWLPVQGTRASRRFSLEVAVRSLLGCGELRAVNRLDRETSGVVLFARDAQAASQVGRALARREVQRSYLAVVAPVPPIRFEVAGPMARVLDPRWIRFALVAPVTPGARPSRTAFTRLAPWHGQAPAALPGAVAVVLARPETGRTHQIRVHLAAAGTPILGDRVYGGDVAGPAARCLLHAARTRLRLPRSGREIVLEAPLPSDFVELGLAGLPGAGVQPRRRSADTLP